LGVTIVGKLVVFGLRTLDGNGGRFGLFTLPVLLATDLLMGGLWTLLDALLGRLLRFRAESGLWLLYGATVLYVASNVPVMRMFGTPLTFAILNAADVALADSLAVYVTASNVVGIGMVLLAALGLPFLTIRLRRQQHSGTRFLLVALTLLTTAVGFAARSQVELRGLSRNVLSSILHTTLLQRDSQGAASDIEVLSLPPLTPESRPPAALTLPSLVAAAQDRSVLWIVLESTAARYLRPYGAEVDPMPQLTALAARSLQFDSIYSAYPESIKGLFSTLCSMYPAAHTTAARYTQARLPCPSIGLQFQAAGYRTARKNGLRMIITQTVRQTRPQNVR